MSLYVTDDDSTPADLTRQGSKHGNFMEGNVTQTPTIYCH